MTNKDYFHINYTDKGVLGDCNAKNESSDQTSANQITEGCPRVERRTNILARRLTENVHSLNRKIVVLQEQLSEEDVKNKLINALINAITTEAITRSRDSELNTLLAFVAAKASHEAAIIKNDIECIKFAEKAKIAAKIAYDFSVKSTELDKEKQTMNDMRLYAKNLSKNHSFPDVNTLNSSTH